MLPLDDAEAAKLALSESAKKVSDLKAKQWEISKNAVVILAFLAAVFHGDLKYATLQIASCWKFVLLGGYFVYFCAIFVQSFLNTNRYREMYKSAAQQLFSEAAQEKYYKSDPENMVEDEGRLQIFLFLVVVAFLALVVVQILSPATTATIAPTDLH